MHANKVYNLEVRKKYNSLELNKNIYKFLFINILNNNSISNKHVFRYLLNSKKFFLKISKVKIKNKCVITGRNNSVEKKMSLSRLQLRSMISFGLLPGFKKSIW